MILLVRHGESEANAGLPSDDPASTPLTETGRRQAEQFVWTFEDWVQDWSNRESNGMPTRIVTSKYLRTKQTAAPLIERYPYVPCEEWAVEEFTYLDPEKYRGTTYEQRTAARIEWWDRADPTYRDGGVAESLVDLFYRVDDLVNKLRSFPSNELTIIFTHGRFMRVLLLQNLCGHPRIRRTLHKESLRKFDEAVPIPNCAILPMRVTPTISFGAIFI